MVKNGSIELIKFRIGISEQDIEKVSNLSNGQVTVLLIHKSLVEHHDGTLQIESGLGTSIINSGNEIGIPVA